MIGTTAAIIGASALSAGAGMLSASKASKAATNAADQNTAVQREMYQQTRSDLAPYAQGGAPAVNALQQRLGLSPAGAAKPAGGFAGTSPAIPPGGGQPPAAPSGPAGGGMDWQGYLASNPDVANSEWLNGLPASQIGDQTGDGQVTAEDRAAYHWQNYGQDGNPHVAPTAMPGAAAAPTERAANPYPMISAERPAATPPPTYGDAPSFGFSADDFTQSPGYAWARDEALRGANAGYGARGILKSGAAVKGVMDRAQGLASQEYNTWFQQQLARQQADRGQYNTDRGYGTGLWDTQQNRQDNIFNTDRGYQTGRYDQETSNLFGLAGLGQSAAAGQANAGNAFAQAQTANNNTAASNAGNAALTAANMFSNTLGQGVQAYGYLKGGAF